jgi:hypothetical protein
MYAFISRVVALTHVDAYRVNIANAGLGEYACSVDVVDDFIAGEETEEIVIGFEGVDRCKDMLEVNCIIRICRVVSIERIGGCIDYDISSRVL